MAPSVFGSRNLGFVGFTPDGSTLLAVSGLMETVNATLVWLDAATLGGQKPRADRAFAADQVCDVEPRWVAARDGRHLAVTPQYLDLLIMTVDHAELADIVRASLTRTFTATECVTYAIDPCPTLEQVRAP